MVGKTAVVGETVVGPKRLDADVGFVFFQQKISVKNHSAAVCPQPE